MTNHNSNDTKHQIVPRTTDPSPFKKTHNLRVDPDLPMGEVRRGPESSTEEEESGRERLKRHRVEVAGRVWIPDIWGQEDFLKEWIDCSAFDASLLKNNIMSARDALVQERRSRANSKMLRI
ncbi:hypothetical protein LguiA_015959 [Lonicera macranthoides]